MLSQTFAEADGFFIAQTIVKMAWQNNTDQRH